MNLQQLKYAVEIAQTGSISKAAKNLFMGQPNLSKSIKELEAEIGITLFSRTSKGVLPTKDGSNFLGYARNIIKQMETLTTLYQKSTVSPSSLSVSVPRASYVAEAFSRFVNSLPAPLNIAYRETNPLSVISDVAGGSATLGILRSQTHSKEYFERLCYEKKLHYEALYAFNMVVLLDENHPLAGLSDIPYHLLNDYPQIIHGDLTPVLPPEDSTLAGSKTQNQIAVFDRGGQFDFLRNVKGAFMWVSPMPFSVLARQHLVQKPCQSLASYVDYAIHSTTQPFTEPELAFLTLLKSEIKQLVKV